MAIAASDILDLVTTTLKDLGRARFTDLGTAKNNFVAYKNLMTRERITIESGTALQWNIVVRNSGAARSVGLFNVDAPNVSDVMQTATAPWRFLTTNYSFDEKEPLMNGGASQIVDLIKVRRNDAMTSLPELCEAISWRNSGSTTSLDFFGIPYYVVYPGSVAAGTTGGFLGGDPAGFTAGAGGLASATYDRWNNYTCSYTSVTKTDLIKKMKRANRLTNFVAPTPGAPYGGAQDYGYYTNIEVITLLEDALEAQNQNLGKDLNSMDGAVLFARRPVEYVSQLDSVAGNPVYGLDWSTMQFVIQSGRFMKEKIVTSPTQHDVVNVHVDTSMQLRCTNRRQNFVIASGTAAI